MLGAELDELRRQVLAEHDFLTMTKLYNVWEKLKSGTVLNESERAIHGAGCVGVIHELHNQIDAAVAEAYGWPADLPDEEILSRLVALNRGARAEEEKRGIIRWLRPDYQAARAKVRAGRGANRSRSGTAGSRRTGTAERRRRAGRDAAADAARHRQAGGGKRHRPALPRRRPRLAPGRARSEIAGRGWGRSPVESRLVPAL